jgi:hypothetical protein
MSKQWIYIDGDRFIDGHGRHVILRGVNLGGDCKLPYPDGGTDRPSDFSDHASVSFVGRPFPLEEADEHLGRIAGWGLNVLRLLVTWEAVEHAGPGDYDRAYLDYVAAVCARAARHGLSVFIDFHQDVWSRMSGGSGAPCWLFDKLGLDYRTFGPANGAHVMQYAYDYADPQPRQESRYPTMSWPVNYRMPVNGIMWTAFFAGAAFTPQWTIDGLNVQDYLQGHYCGALRVLAERLRELPNVIGFDSLNEPGLGWIGRRMTERPSGRVSGEFAVGLAGPAWTPLDGLRVARGMRTAVPRLGVEDQTLVVTDEIDANPQGISMWKPGVADPFEVAGAWRRDGDAVAHCDEDFFCRFDGRRIDPEKDLMHPFFHRVTETMRAIRPEWLLFAEINPHVITLGRSFPAGMPKNSVNASHWYDIALLVSKQFPQQADGASLKALRERYQFQLGYLKLMAQRINGGAPTLIGECGIPYDINDGEAYARWARGERGGDLWQAHVTALRLMYDTLDELLLSSTQWNYTASNRNDLRCGDGWNQEDLSIFSRDQMTGSRAADGGGRAVAGFSRPYVQRAQGFLRVQRLDGDGRRFFAEIETSLVVDAPSEIHIPAHFADAVVVDVTAGRARWSFDTSSRLLSVWALEHGLLTIEVSAGAAASA